MKATRKTDHIRILGPFVLALLVLLLPAVLQAREPDAKKYDAQGNDAQDNDPQVVIVSEDGEEIVIDMEAVHEIVAEAMSELDEALAEMEDMQFQVRLGRDNRLDLSYDDKTFEVDLDQIMSQVARAVRAGCDGIDTHQWARSHDRWSDSSEKDLRRELKTLQKEMKELRREMKKVGDSLEE
jgi:hypothetical protein